MKFSIAETLVLAHISSVVQKNQQFLAVLVSTRTRVNLIRNSYTSSILTNIRTVNSVDVIGIAPSQTPAALFGRLVHCISTFSLVVTPTFSIPLHAEYLPALHVRLFGTVLNSGLGWKSFSVEIVNPKGTRRFVSKTSEFFRTYQHWSAK